MLGCVVWATPSVLASKLLIFFSLLMQKAVLWVAKKKVQKSFHLLIYTVMGNSYLTCVADSPRMF